MVMMTRKKSKASRKLTRLQSVVENLGTNVLIADADQQLVYMNKRSEETLRGMAKAIHTCY